MPTAEQPIDIRTVTPEEYWKVFEKKWTSLLELSLSREGERRSRQARGAEQMRLRHDMRNSTRRRSWWRPSASSRLSRAG